MNDNLMLISGDSATGKSASLANIKNPEGVMYLNCENNKKLPFRSKFMQLTITDPYTIYDAFTEAESMPEVHTIVVDTLTFMMDMFESVHVLGSSNTMQMWGEYAQFFKNLMAQYVAVSTKNVIFLAHTSDKLNEADQCVEKLVQVKGSLMKTGIESYFSTVISAKKISLKKLKAYENPLLTITADDEIVGYKHVFQTKQTKETVNERMRSSMGMWTVPETYIDNDAQAVIDKLHWFYDEEV